MQELIATSGIAKLPNTLRLYFLEAQTDGNSTKSRGAFVFPQGQMNGKRNKN